MDKSTGVDRRDVLKKDDWSRLIGAEKASLYWDSLHKYLVARLTKPEFDTVVLSTLGAQYVPAHNSFIRGLLHNAHCSVRPVPPTGSTFTRQKPRPPVKKPVRFPVPKAPAKNVAPPPSPKNLKRRRPASSSARSGASRAAKGATAKSVAANNKAIAAVQGVSPILKRMRESSKQHNLDVAPDGALVLMAALEKHLQTIVSASYTSLRTTQPVPTSLFSVPPVHLPKAVPAKALPETSEHTLSELPPSLYLSSSLEHPSFVDGRLLFNRNCWEFPPFGVPTRVTMLTSLGLLMATSSRPLLLGENSIIRERMFL